MSTDLSLDEARRVWDDAASSFDEEADHGLRDPRIRAAWMKRLQEWLPAQPATILDAGCGTGSLSVVMAALGHDVTGIDLSPAMIARARDKAANSGFRISFRVTDANAPGFSPGTCDAVLCRHLLWTLPDPAATLERWATLLKPGGRLVLIEGYWHTGVGIHSATLLDALPPSLTDISVEALSDAVDLWGKVVSDERYVVRATLPVP